MALPPRVRLPHPQAERSIAAAAIVDTEDWRPLTGCLSALAMPVATGADFRASLAEYARLLQREDAPVAMALLYPQPDAFRSMADIEILPDVVASLSPGSGASDEEIEACGYMGWLARASRNA